MDKKPGYVLHKGTGQAVVRVNGRDLYLGKHGTPESKKKYNALVKQYRENPVAFSGVLKSHNGLTVHELMVAYLKHCKVYYAQQLEQELPRIKLALRPVNDMFADHVASKFGIHQYRAVRDHVIAEPSLTTGKQRSRNYVNDRMKRVLAMFKWGAMEQLIPYQTYELLKLIPCLKRGRTKARETEEVQPVEQSVVDATLEILPTVVADMVRLQLLTGARSSEICGLRPMDIDKSKEIWTAELVKHKTVNKGKARTLFFGPKSKEILARYLDRKPDEFLFRPCDSEKQRRAKRHAERVTPSSCGNTVGTNRVKRPKVRPGLRYTKDTYRRCIARICEANGIQHWHPHQLRHSRATDLRDKFDIEAAQAFLGHSDAEMTLRYAKKSKAKSEQVAKECG